MTRVIKIRNDVVAWCVIGGSLFLVMFGLYDFSLQSKEVSVEADKRIHVFHDKTVTEEVVKHSAIGTYLLKSLP